MSMSIGGHLYPRNQELSVLVRRCVDGYYA